MPGRNTLAFLLCASIVSIADLTGASASGETAPAIASTDPGLPAGTLDQRLTIRGRLQLAGENYFLDPRFVIVDEHNHVISITTWAPLEIPPSPPGAPHPVSVLRTMQDYLDRTLSVIGIHRMVTGTAGQPSLLGAPGESYLEVEVVTDVETGEVVFSALGATESPAGAGADAGAMAGRQGEDAQTAVAVPIADQSGEEQQHTKAAVGAGEKRAIEGPATAKTDSGDAKPPSEETVLPVPPSPPKSSEVPPEPVVKT